MKPLTPDQLRIAERVSQGWKDQQIASDMGISYDAARQRLRLVCHKIGASNRAQVAAWYVRAVEVKT